MEVIVQNRQRLHKINCTELQIMAEQLAEEAISNLKEQKPKWLTGAQLKIVQNTSLLSLIITSKDGIKKLNKLWLGKNKTTDVLSFPLLELADLNMSKDETCELGEIFIAYEKAREQALEYNHSLKRELAFLFVHGFLHILGFDHQDEASEKEMFGRQKQILLAAGYSRR